MAEGGGGVKGHAPSPGARTERGRGRACGRLAAAADFTDRLGPDG